jgi:hypothetical protein
LLYFGKGDTQVIEQFATEPFSWSASDAPTTAATATNASTSTSDAPTTTATNARAYEEETNDMASSRIGLLAACVCALAAGGKLSEGRELIALPQLQPAMVAQSTALLAHLPLVPTKAARKLAAFVQQMGRTQQQVRSSRANDTTQDRPGEHFGGNESLLTLAQAVEVSLVDTDERLLAAMALLRSALAVCPVASMDCEWQPSKQRAPTAAMAYQVPQLVPVNLVQVAVAEAVYVLDVQALLALQMAKGPSDRSILTHMDMFFDVLLPPAIEPKCIVGFAAAGDFKKIRETMEHATKKLDDAANSIFSCGSCLCVLRQRSVFGVCVVGAARSCKFVCVFISGHIKMPCVAVCGSLLLGVCGHLPSRTLD